MKKTDSSMHDHYPRNYFYFLSHVARETTIKSGRGTVPTIP